MRKFIIVIIYFIVFWILIPLLIISLSDRLDLYLNIKQSPFFWSGCIILAVSVTLLGISIWEYFKFTGELPVSAYPPGKIIRRGMYNYWRHPIYLFYTTTIIGIALIIGSLSMLLIVIPGFILMEIVYVIFEEKMLVRRFGETYVYYKKQTGLVLPHPYQLLRYPLLVLFKGLFRYQSVNPDLIPGSPPYFIVAEHKNYLDPFFIALSVSHPISYLTTFEVYRSNPIKWLLTFFFSISRKRFKVDLASGRSVSEVLNKGGVIGLFPEGERSWTGETQKFKPEVMKFLLKKKDIPILPVRIVGNYHSWPRWAETFRRCKIIVEFHEPFYPDPGSTADELEARIRNCTGISKIPDIFPVSTSSFYKGLDKVLYRCCTCNDFNSFVMRQNIFKCNNCGLELQVSSDLTLILHKDGYEKTMSIAEYYHSIRVAPEDSIFKLKDRPAVDSAGQEEIIVDMKDSGICQLFAETSLNNFQFVLSGKLLLCESNIIFRSGNNDHSLKYMDISSITTESNYKLQLYDHVARQLYQVIFVKNNVLQWQDIITSIIFLKTGRLVNTR